MSTISKSHRRSVRLRAKRKLEAFRVVVARTAKSHRERLVSLTKTNTKESRREADRVKDKYAALFALWTSKRQPHKRMKEEAHV